MRKNASERPRVNWSLVLVVAIWASTFINIKVVLPEVPPNTLACLRFALASLAFLIIFLWRGFPRIERRDWWRIAFCGLTGVTLYNFLQNQGLRYAGATDASILASLAPVFMTLLAWLILKETPSRQKVSGIIIAFLGTVLLVTNGSLAGLSAAPLRLLGDLLILSTGLSWAAYNIVLKGLLERYAPLCVLAYSTFAGTLFLAPLMWLEAPLNLAGVSPAAWLNIAYLGFMASALAYLLWNSALSRTPVVTAGAYLYLIPVFTAIIAAFYLHESPGIFTFIGGLLVLSGTYYASK